jgi:sugar lactone lactonase YvrE
LAAILILGQSISMKKIFVFLIVAILLSFIIFLILPSPIDPISWDPPTDKGFTGDFEANGALDNMSFLIENDCVGCEDLAFDTTANVVYSGEDDGDIIRVNLQTRETEVVANTGGRPLGMQMHPNGNLIIADGIKGLLSLDLKSSVVSLLTKSYNNQELKFVDDLDIDSLGVIYFSDASSKYGMNEVIEDLMERRPHGALYSFDPATDKTELLLDDLYFANGVALAEDESFLFINETGNYSISKYWLKGPKAGTREFVNDNLPGFPDNITCGTNGIFWLTLVSPRQQSLDDIMPKPFIRKLIMKLPKSIQPAPTHYACVVGLDEHGKVKYNYQSSHPKFVEITSVTEHEGRIYFGSLVDTGIAYYTIE